MALANNPPSGTFYDPEHDGVAMASQGVHEHWNNATQKQYTRNIGTGDGIDLLYVTEDPTKNAAARKMDQRRGGRRCGNGLGRRPGLALDNVVLGAGATRSERPVSKLPGAV